MAICCYALVDNNKFYYLYLVEIVYILNEWKLLHENRKLEQNIYLYGLFIRSKHLKWLKKCIFIQMTNAHLARITFAM